MTRVLVTGGTGFVGANLVRRLVADGHDVHQLLRSVSNPWRLTDIQHRLTRHVVALDDELAVRTAIAAIQPRWIFHLAVHGAYPGQTNLAEMVRTNIQGTVNLVEACLEVGFDAFVNTGSSSEYGVKDHAPSEESWLEPNSHYAVTKASATLFCRFTALHRKVHITTLRLYSAYGPYEEPTRLIPTLIVRGLAGTFPPLVNPAIGRDFIHVDDVVDAFLLVASTPGQPFGAVYNVGTGVQVTLGQAIDIARRELVIPIEPTWGTMGARMWDSTVWIADPRAIADATGWRPRFDFQQGFASTARWFQDRPDMLDLYTKRLAVVA